MLLVMASFLKQYKALIENSLKQVVSRKAQSQGSKRTARKPNFKSTHGKVFLSHLYVLLIKGFEVSCYLNCYGTI